MTDPFTVTAGTLDHMDVLPDSTTLSTATDYRFRLTLTQGAAADTHIVVTMPSEYTLTAGSCTLTTLTGLDHAPPQCNIAGQVITLSQLFTAAQSAGASIVFKVTSNVITNPAVANSANSITFETKTPGGVLIASGSIPNIFPFVPLTSVTMIPDSMVASALATYSIAFNSGIVYSANSNIVFSLSLPPEMSIPDASAAQSSCTLTADLVGGTCAVSGTTISVTKDFGAAPPSSGTAYTFSIGGLKNPRVATMTSSGIATVTDGGNYVEGMTRSIMSFAISVPEFTSFTVTPTSNTVSEATVYTFTATSSVDLKDGDIMTLDKQTEVTNPTNPVCKGVTNLETELITFLDTTKVKFVMDFTGGTELAAGTSFSFTCESYTNPSTSAAPTGNFAVLVEAPTTGNNDIAQFTGTL